MVVYDLFNRLKSDAKERAKLAAAIEADDTAEPEARNAVISWAQNQKLDNEQAKEVAIYAKTILKDADTIQAFYEPQQQLWVDGWSLTIFICIPRYEKVIFPEQFAPSVYVDLQGNSKYVVWAPTEMNLTPLAFLGAKRALESRFEEMAVRADLAGNTVASEQLRDRVGRLF